MESKTVRSIRLTELLVAQLCAYSMLSALCFAYPLYLFDCSGSSTLYGAVAAIAFVPGVLATPAGGILADRGRHRGVLVVLGIVLMVSSLLFIPMKHSLPLTGGALKRNASSGMTGDSTTCSTCRNDFRESIRYLFQNASLLVVFLLAAVLNLALVGLTIGAPVIVAKHLEMQSSFVGIIEVAMGLGGLVGSGVVGMRPHRFSFKGICRYVAMICFGVVPIIVTLLSGPDELAFAALAAGSAWVMAWASITSVEIVSFVQRSAPKELCGKVLALVYMTLSCATPIGQLVYGLAYDRWTPAIVFAGMLAVLTLTTVLLYRLKSRFWRLS